MDTLKDYMLLVTFDDGKTVLYDVKEDIHTLPGYNVLLSDGLFQRAQLDESRTCISWTSDIDLPSDAVYDYGMCINSDVIRGESRDEYNLS